MSGRPPSQQYWLEGDLGRVLIRPAGFVVGRSPECDVVIADARVSRHQLLLRPTDDGVEMTVTGRIAVRVNDAPVAASATLRSGDAIAVLDRVFRVVGAATPRAAAACVWGVEARAGVFHRILTSPFVIGGAEGDDLHINAWPPSVLTLTLVQSALVLETSYGGVACGGLLQEGQVVSVPSGAVARYLDQSLRFVSAAVGRETATVPSDDMDLPRLARLEFLPRGGRLTLGFGAWERTLALADRRCDLVAALLFPPAPFSAGDAIPDEVLLPRIWPDGRAGRVELNTLVFRVRKDLVRADIDGPTLLDRGDGATRFRLLDGATVSLVRA
jgi:hypothetical protein